VSNPAPQSAADLLDELAALGVQIEADGGRLRYRPRDRVTADLAQRLLARKGELLDLLAKRAESEKRMDAQLAALVPYRAANGKWGWINPRYRAELERLGL
jgi:hypothetical protein